MKSSLMLRIVVGSAIPFWMGLAIEGMVRAQQIPETLYSEMKWRMIGPFRAGKVNAVAGVPRDPRGSCFVAGGGGGWETTGDGTEWETRFRQQTIPST